MSSNPDHTVYLLALGGNLGNVANTFGRAMDLLVAHRVFIDSISRLYRTAPRDLDGGILSDVTVPFFLNAACCVRTHHPPATLLRITQSIEASCGRGPAPRALSRSLDIDLIDCRPRAYVDNLLEIPHPRAHRRRFVLQPLVDIAPRWPLGPGGETVGELLNLLESDSTFLEGSHDASLVARCTQRSPY